MRRRKLLAALAGLVILAGVGVFLALRPAPLRVTWENFCCIEKGMTPDEVEAILGPQGDYSTGPIKQSDGSRPKGFGDKDEVNPFSGSTRRRVGLWWSDVGYIFMFYGPSGTAVFGGFLPMERIPQAPLDNLLWRAKRQWRKWFPER